MGKTVSTLTAIDILMRDNFEIKKVLVVAPLRVAQTVWDAEIEKWDHLKGLRVSKVLGTKQQRENALAVEADIYVINRENVVWLVDAFGHVWDFDMLVIDELSSFKSTSSKRFRKLRTVRPLIKRVVGLTGTPAPNGLLDLWPQMYLLDRGERLESTVTKYRMKYFSAGASKGHIVYEWKIKQGAEEEIWQKIDDITVSMKAIDWLDMPECQNIFRLSVTSSAEKKLYDALLKDKVLPTAQGEGIVAETAAALAGKLLQMANGAVYDADRVVHHIHDAKLDVLDEIVEEAQGETLLVFYGYKHDKARILARHPEAVELSSEDSIRQFQQGVKGLYIAHPASVGHGLNLHTGGNVVVWFSVPWSLELYQQANTRLYRQGQTQTVRIYHIITQGTIDEDVIQAIENKATTQDRLLEALKHRLQGA